MDIGNVIAAFSEEQVERLTSLSKTRLRYWDKSDFFKPSYAGADPRLPYSRFYSFRDVVALRTLELLRVQNNVPLQQLRKVAEKLAHLKDGLWTKTILYVVNRKVVMVNPETQLPEEVVSGQYLLGIPLKQVMSDTRTDIGRMQKRSDSQVGQIIRQRSIAHNSWVVSGTRIPITSVLRLHEDGYTVEQIIGEYPDLTPADIQACLTQNKAQVA